MRKALALLSIVPFLLAGCNEAAPETVADGDAPLADYEPTVTSEPYHVEGRTPLGGCAGHPSATGACQYVGGDSLTVLENAGSIVRVTGTLSWTAETPASEQMDVLVLVPNANGNWVAMSGVPGVSGTSPLEVNFLLAGVGDDLALWFSTYEGRNQNGAWLGAQTPVDFTFDGTIERAAPAA